MHPRPRSIPRGTLLKIVVFLLLCSGAHAAVSVTTLARLGGDPDGYHPEAGLIDGGDGFFYGTTEAGGPGNFGTIYRISPQGVFATIYVFTGGSDGANPATALAPGGDGNFYGVTSSGGSGHAGTIFRVTPAGVLTTLHTFSALNYYSSNSDGGDPEAALTRGTDGNLYGTTRSGGTPATGVYGAGTVFRITTAGVFTTLANFNSNSGNGPVAPTAALVEGADGNFYGTTKTGGAGPDLGGDGTVYQVTPAGVLTTIYSFTAGADGAEPSTGLVRGKDDNFYGATLTNTLFQITPAGALTTIHKFAQSNEGLTPSGLIVGADGNLYGTTSFRGLMGYGSIYQATTAGAVTVLYSFANGGSLGFNPNALLQGSDGNLYGTTEYGGNGAAGMVYQLTPTGALTALHLFNAGGSDSEAGLLQAQDGNFYGTTVSGGTMGGGTVFAFDTSGDILTVHSFDPATEGSAPAARLVQDQSGNMFGTATQGGPASGGTLFELIPNGATTSGQPSLLARTAATRPVTALFTGVNPTYDDLYVFLSQLGLTPTEIADVEELITRTRVGSSSTTETIYGIATRGGPNGGGGIYSYTVGGSATFLYEFGGQPNDGLSPRGIVQGSDGNFYGVTVNGGTAGFGTVYKYTPGGTETPLYSFTGTGDGVMPAAGIVQGIDGNFYGTTQYASFNSQTGIGAGGGTVFSITPSGVLTTLHAFASDGSEGKKPVAALLQGSDGNFYGTTSSGSGTLFSIKPDGTFTNLYVFGTAVGDGDGPVAPLIEGTDRNLYGTTSAGGTDGSGVVFRVVLNAATAPAPIITSAGTASGEVGAAFSYQIVASNSPTSFGATGLPTGLGVDPSAGLISGTPTQAGNFPVAVSATNAGGTGTATLTLTIAALPVVAPSITSAPVANGQVGVAFNFQITAANAPTNFNASGLPDGLSIETTSGVISGTPTAAGTFTVNLSASNSGGAGTATLTLTIDPPPPPVASVTCANPETHAGGKPVKLVFTLSQAPTVKAKVKFALTGSAVNGQDYAFLDGKAKFAPGQTTVKVKLVPVGDLDGAASKKVKVTLLPNAGYVLGTPASVKIKILAP